MDKNWQPDLHEIRADPEMRMREKKNTLEHELTYPE